MKICAIGLRGIPDVMGGIETHCEHLYPRLARLDESLDITVIGRSGYAKRGRFSNVRVLTLWAPRMKGLETLVHTPLAILYARLFLHPDVIHLHAIGPGFFAPLARLLGFRVIATHHAPDYERPKWGRIGRGFLRAGEWMLAKYADEVICVSHTIQHRLSGQFPQDRNRFSTIRNGTPSSNSAEPDSVSVLSSLGVEPGRYILCVGRLDPTKGFHEAIEAFNLAKPAGFKLLIVGGAMGDDAYSASLMASASADVIFAGARPAEDVRTLYRHAALFLHPSHLEGFAMVVLEALAADTPMLVSDIPAHLEVELDEASYFPCGDIRALASALAKGDYARLHCSRRVEIIAENDWDTAARRHRDILVRRVRRPRPEAAAPSP